MYMITNKVIFRGLSTSAPVIQKAQFILRFNPTFLKGGGGVFHIFWSSKIWNFSIPGRIGSLKSITFTSFMILYNNSQKFFGFFYRNGKTVLLHISFICCFSLFMSFSWFHNTCMLVMFMHLISLKKNLFQCHI